jgi:hypothetical protein
MTTSAAKTKSMGLLADLPTGRQARRCHARPTEHLSIEINLGLVVRAGFLHRYLPIFCTVSNSRRLSGLSHRDNFIVTANLSPLIGTVPARTTDLRNTVHWIISRPVGRAKTPTYRQVGMPTPTQTATPHTTGPLAVRLL